MNRRELLKNAGFLTTSVAVFGLAGCGSSNSSISEEQALTQMGHAGSYQFPQGVIAADPKPDSIILWTRVVMANDDAVSQTDSSRANVDVKLELSTSAGFDELLTLPIALVAQAKYDNTIRHKLTGLSAATTYYYRFRAGTGVSRVGRFKTAPALTADANALSFAFMACQDWSVNHWIGVSALVKQSLDFVVHLGDYIYEAAGDSYQIEAVEAMHDQLHLPSQTVKPGSASAKIAVTVEDYRYLYKKYRTDLRLQELHARFALIAIWDDHEFSDDCWQNNETYDNGSVVFLKADGSISATPLAGALPISPGQLPGQSDATAQTIRRRSANRAWFEFMPADIPALDEAADENFKTVKIYRDLQFGKLAHFVMTDERLYRADHVVPEATPNPNAGGSPLGSIGSRYFVPEEDVFKAIQKGKMLAAVNGALNSLPPADPNRPFLETIIGKLIQNPPIPLTAAEDEFALPLVSVLGQTQRGWWKDKMQSSTATWKFWGNEVSLLRMALNLNALPAIVAQAAGDPVLAKLLSTYIINADQWDGYAAERANLTGFLAANSIKNVVAVTGDIHAFFAGEVPANFGAYVEGSAAMVDLVTAGISSSSFWSYLAGVVGDFESEVNAVKAARTANPTTYENALESGVNPFAALRPLVYTCANMLVYQQVKSGVLAAADLSTPEKQQAAFRQVFEVFLTQEVSLANGGYALQNTLNETLAGDMGEIIKGLAGLPVNPYTGTTTPPAKQNPWIKYVETKTQGFITVKVTPTQVEAKFHHTATLATNPTADNVVLAAKAKTVVINKDSTQLTIS